MNAAPPSNLATLLTLKTSNTNKTYEYLAGVGSRVRTEHSFKTQTLAVFGIDLKNQENFLERAEIQIPEIQNKVRFIFETLYLPDW